MELRPLSLFVLTCLHRRQSLAAAAAGVSASTISAAVAGLEAELGIALFRRGADGLNPTDAGHWLFGRGAEILRAASTCAAPRPPGQVLAVRCGLRLTLGRLSLAATAATTDFAAHHPGWAVRLRFRSSYALEDEGAQPGDDLLLDYGPGEALFSDPWAMVANRAGEAPAILLPALPPAQEALIRARLGGVPEVLPEGADPLDRLRRARGAAALVAPLSLLSDGLGRAGLEAVPLDPPLDSPVSARILTMEPERQAAARAFLARLRLALDGGLAPDVPAQPLRLADIRALDMLAATASLTAAAQALGVTQPALSAQLAGIEARLGQRLFRRDSRGIAPLPAMEARAAACRRVLDLLADLRRGARQIAAQSRQEVTLGLSGLVTDWPQARERLAQAIGTWQARLPGAPLRLEPATPEGVARGDLGLALAEVTGASGPGHDLAGLGPVLRLGEGPLLAPGALRGLLPPGAVQGCGLALALDLARTGAASVALPERLALDLGAGLTMRPLLPDPLRLRLLVTTERPLGEAERALAEAIRAAFSAE